MLQAGGLFLFPFSPFRPVDWFLRTCSIRPPRDRTLSLYWTTFRPKSFLFFLIQSRWTATCLFSRFFVFISISLAGHSRLFMPKTARRTTIPSGRGEYNKGSGLWLKKKKKKRNNNNKRSKRQNGDESDLFATDEELLDVSLAQFLFAVDLLDRQTGQRIWPSWQSLALRLQSCFP